MDPRNFSENITDDYLNEALRNESLGYFLKGVDLFNLKDYESAARNFWGGIVTLRKIDTKDLTDNDKRNYIDLCINLSDSYNHLLRYKESEGAFEEAIKTFSNIKQKTIEESLLQNAAMFRQHFEKRVSNKSYLNSHQFKVHNTELLQVHTENTLDIGVLSLSGKQQPFFASAATAAPFVASFDTQQDDHYRNTASHFIAYGNTCDYQKNIQEAEAAYREALKAYQLIKSKSEGDQQVISQLQQKIDSFKMTDLANQMAQFGFSSQQHDSSRARQADRRHDDDMDCDDDRNRYQRNG